MSRLEFYVDVTGFHRWRIVAANGEIVAGATEGFASLQKARENYELAITPPDRTDLEEDSP